MRRVVCYLLLVVSLLLTTYYLLLTVPAFGDEPSDLEDQLQDAEQKIQETESEKNKKEQELEEEQKKEKVFTGSLNSLQNQLSYSQSRLTETLVVIDNKAKEIEATVESLQQKGEELEHQKDLISQQVRGFYINSFYDPVVLFLQDNNFSKVSKTLVFRESVITSFKKRIIELNQKIEELKGQQEQLEKQEEILQSQKLQLERQKQSYEQEVIATQKAISHAKLQQVTLQQELLGLEHQLSELTQKQKDILAAKAAAALSSTTVGDIEITQLVIEKAPPEGEELYFSFWTYGYPHRVGMNQYGAYGRSKAGQTYDQILAVYYSGAPLVDYPVPEKIKIEKNGVIEEVFFEEDYLMGIGEMPSCWGKQENGGMEALKAQAVAARTYALSYTADGKKSICIDQRCQVYIGEGKIEGTCGEYWKKAVEETRGKVITYNGEPISAWYASTAGGFTLSSAEVWGVSCGYAQGIVDFANAGDLNSSFDGPQYGNSPWYHKSWGNEPWLSVSQVEDLLNAALLPEKYNDKLQEAAKGGMSTEEIVDVLSAEEIEPVFNLTSIEHFGSATKSTTKLRAYSPGGYKEIEASRFRFVFNLRSPGTDAIWTSRFDLITNQ